MNRCRITVEHLETLVTRAQDRMETFRLELDGIRRGKVETRQFEKKMGKLDDGIRVVRVVLENTLNEFKSIENFTSK